MPGSPSEPYGPGATCSCVPAIQPRYSPALGFTRQPLGAAGETVHRTGRRCSWNCFRSLRCPETPDRRQRSVEQATRYLLRLLRCPKTPGQRTRHLTDPAHLCVLRPTSCALCHSHLQERRGTGATVAKMVSSSRLEPKWRQTPKDVDMYNIYFWSTTGYSARTERGRATPEGEAWRVGKASLPKPRDLMKGRGCAALIHVTRWPPGAPAPPSEASARSC